MFLSEKVGMSYDIDKDGYVVSEKLSFEDAALKQVVPMLKEIDVHPYRWTRITVPVNFIHKPLKLRMPPGFGWLVNYMEIEKSFLMYDYLTWKLRSYKMKLNLDNENETIKKTKKIIDVLFLEMLSKETSMPGWKWFLVRFLVLEFSHCVLAVRDDESKRMVDAN